MLKEKVVGCKNGKRTGRGVVMSSWEGGEVGKIAPWIEPPILEKEERQQSLG